MGSTRGRTRTLEAARRVAYLWNSPDVKVLRDHVHPDLARELDELLAATRQPELEPAPEVAHRAAARTITHPGRAENGYQPEREYVWSCSCRPGEQSGDMGGSGWAKQAADTHIADPTQFPGWLT